MSLLRARSSLSRKRNYRASPLVSLWVIPLSPPRQIQSTATRTARARTTAVSHQIKQETQKNPNETKRLPTTQFTFPA